MTKGRGALFKREAADGITLYKYLQMTRDRICWTLPCERCYCSHVWIVGIIVPCIAPREVRTVVYMIQVHRYIDSSPVFT